MPTRLAAALLLTAGLLAATTHAQQPTAAVTAPDQPRLVLQPYQVADLVVPVGDGKAGKTDEARLIKLIQDTVAPKSWASRGGRGTIDYFPLTMTLVINQTPDVQEQVADLLAALRREQDTQVALEVRFVTLPEGFFERAGVDVNGGADKPVFLTDKQLARLMEAVQGEQRANVMQAPKVTMLNGQAAQVDCTDKQFFVTHYDVVCVEGRAVALPKNEEVVLGFRMSACPVVSADRRFVQVDLKIDQTGLASAAVPLFPFTMEVTDSDGKPRPFTQYIQQPTVNRQSIEKKVAIPDGGTVLFGGLKKVTEGRNEYGPPVLTKIPYANRLFKNVGYGRETQNVYVLVTPRVIVNEEEERRQTGVSREQTPVGAEESEACPPACRQNKALAELLKAYDEACAAGRKDEVTKFAQAALILDPTCFAKGRGR